MLEIGEFSLLILNNLYRRFDPFYDSSLALRLSGIDGGGGRGSLK